MPRLSASREKYLRAVLHLDAGGKGTRVADIARQLRVTAPSACRAVATLAKHGYVCRLQKHRVALTAAGRSMAKSAQSRYQTLRLYLVEALHLHYTLAEKQAAALAPFITEECLCAMEFALAQNGDWAALHDGGTA